MPLFFFHVSDGPDLISDPDGSYFPDVVFAKSEAIHSARELMSQSIIRCGRLGIDRRFEIADQEGNIVALWRIARQSTSAERRSGAEYIALRSLWIICDRNAHVPHLCHENLCGRLIPGNGSRPSIGRSPRDNNRSAIIIKIGAALWVVNVGEAALIERLGSVLGAVVYVLNFALLGPEIPCSVADAIIGAVVTAERSRRRGTSRAKTEHNNAGHKKDWAPFD